MDPVVVFEHIINECLKYFISQKTRIYQLSGIIIPSYSQQEILAVLTNTGGLFEILGGTSNPLIKISISVRI